MEARILRAALLAAVLAVSMGAKYRTPNFIIETRDPQLAEQLGKAAEKYRRELAVTWLGKPMPDWSRPCPVTIHVGPHLGAGGATTFVFDRGEVFGWRMAIQGSAERLLDSVLPHEITHMIFASHFRRPLPRWADEGGATSVEHASELMKHRRMLVFYLKNGGGIPFSRMFALTEYPRKMMLLYAQGYSLADFLIQKGGRRKFVDFLGDGLKDNQWSAAIARHYGIRNLGALQSTWLAWVKDGSPPLQRAPSPSGSAPQLVAVAGDGKLPRPEPNLLYRYEDEPFTSRSSKPEGQTESAAGETGTAPSVALPAEQIAAASAPTAYTAAADGWHPAGRRPPPASGPADADLPAMPVQTQSAHPQPFQQPRQIILEWGQ
jgi:hypothetical protein